MFLDNLRRKTLKTNPTPEVARHRRGLVRMAGYLSFTALVCSGISIRHARAEYSTHSIEFGKQMFELAQARSHDVTKIVFNGQSMYIGSSVTQDDPKTVLKRYEDYCKANPGQPSAASWADLQKNAIGLQDAPDSVKTGLIHVEEEDSSVVACFVKGPATKSTLQDAFTHFYMTGELGALGELRYVYTKRDPKTNTTHVLSAWTDSTFNMLSIAGDDDDHDVQGHDFPEVPRLPRSVRTLSAYADGTPYGINVYRTDESPAKVYAYFDQRMHDASWEVYDPQLTDGAARGYLKDGVVVTVTSSVLPDGHFVSVGLAGVSPHDKLGRN
jgi:hypothetical protein